MKKLFFVILFFCSFVLCSAQTKNKIPKFLVGPPGREDGRAIRELVRQPERWATCRKFTEGIVYADHVLARQFKDDKELADLFAGLNKINIPLQLEVGAVKPWGPTGAEAFDKQRGNWQRFLRLDAKIIGIAMDEPLVCATFHLKKENPAEYAAAETAEFIALVRQHFPDWSIGDIEGFPSINADEIIAWIDLLEAKLKAKNVRGLDFMRLDVDWMHFVQNTGRGSWSDLRRVENHCRSKKIPFSLISWDANFDAMSRRGFNSDRMWDAGCLQMMYNYISVGGNPDQIVVQSWSDAPKTVLPDNDDFTFTRCALDIAEEFLKKEETPEK
ncbi:MAG: hypothetical protein FWE67_13660 [Planctomycetaceae bacterium]|nr:hypothetical protein [Planctomycetaceae bacterium]